MQRIVVAQRSKEQGIEVNFVGTTMQRAAFFFRLLVFPVRKEEGREMKVSTFVVLNAPDFAECFFIVYISQRNIFAISASGISSR